MSNEFQSGSRSNYRAKRKKTNLILNSLIVIVLGLIFFVAYTIFSSGADKTSPEKDIKKSETSQSTNKNDQAKEKSDKEVKNSVKEESNTEKNTEDSNEVIAPEKAGDTQAVVSEGDGSSNVLKTIENPAWKPIGTSQTGSHTSVYSTESVDWQEMLHAISYATGLEQGNMVVHWLGRDKSTANASFGTVYSKDKQQMYNVYIKWVDGEGWMPTKVEVLSEIN